MNLSYRDLVHLSKVLRNDPNDRTDYVLAKVSEEINKIPEWMFPVCLYKGNGDIPFLTGRQIEDKIRELSQTSGKPSVLIYTPHEVIANSVFERLLIMGAREVHRYQQRSTEIWFNNGLYVKISHPKSLAIKGKMVDLGVMYVADTWASA